MSEQEKLEDLLVTLAALFLDYFDIHPNKLKLEDNPYDLSNGDKVEFGHLLIDVHEHYNVKIDYEPETEFELFKSIEDICEYFMKKI